MLESRLPKPTPIFDDLFPHDRVVCARPPFIRTRTFPSDTSTLEAIGGIALTMSGEMTALCHEGCVTDTALAFLSRGRTWPVPSFRTFTDRRSFRRAVRDAWKCNEGRIAFQYAQDPTDAPVSSYSVNPTLLRYLNNKANLANMVGPGFVPSRDIVSVDRLQDILEASGDDVGFVIKAVTDRPCAGGYGVAIKRPGDRLNPLPSFLDGVCDVVVEEFLELHRSWGVQFGIDPAGSVTLLGSTEQIVSSTGQYRGGWIEHAGAEPSVGLVGECRAIADRAAALGYHGFCCFDVGLAKDGRQVVFDLNFRLGATTPALLAVQALKRRQPHGAEAVLRWATFSSERPLRDLVSRIESAAPEHCVVPLSVFDATPACDTTVSVVGALVGGRDRLEVERRIRTVGSLC